jgi:membrane associated rhomboid family serine protease
MKIWTLLTIVAATILYVVALSNAAYEATSPASFAWHVLLRKIYSVAAFALVGYLLRRALREHGRDGAFPTCVWGVAAYSAAIEIGQDLAGSHEGLAWNAIDVACGALGGFIAVADLTWRRAREPRPR